GGLLDVGRNADYFNRELAVQVVDLQPPSQRVLAGKDPLLHGLIDDCYTRSLLVVLIGELPARDKRGPHRPKIVAADRIVRSLWSFARGGSAILDFELHRQVKPKRQP